MATRTIKRNWKVNGVLTNPTSMKLSNSAGTYGVKRDDTDGVVVADGAEMSQVSTGVYTYTFTEPSDYGGPYTAWVEIVYADSTRWFEHTLPVAAIVGLTPTHPDLCVRGDTEAIFGIGNVAKWADLDEDQSATKIAARIGRAIIYATTDFYDRLRGGVVAIPFTTPDHTSISLCARLAGVWLYESRGVEDWDPETGAPGHILTWHRDHVYRELNKIKNGQRRIEQTRVSEDLPAAVLSANWDNPPASEDG